MTAFRERMTSDRIRMAALAASLAVSILADVHRAEADSVRFRIQPESSEITFKATSRFQNADGRFQRFGGDVVVDPASLGAARVVVTVEAASIDTGITRRDNHLRDEDFFHVERFPSITFQSLRVEGAAPRLMVVGRLTMRGVTREVTVPVEVDIAGGKLAVRGAFAINRQHYGVSYNSFWNPIDDTVQIAFVLRGQAAPGG